MNALMASPSDCCHPTNHQTEMQRTLTLNGTKSGSTSPPMSRLLTITVAFYILHTLEALGFVGRMLYGEWAGQPGNKFTALINIVFMAVSASLFLLAIQRPGRAAALAWPPIAVALFLCSSALWSIDPSTTIRRGIFYLFVVLGGTGIALRVELDDYMRLLRQVCAMAAIGSLLLLIVSPSNALMISTEDVPEVILRGVFSQKNVLGQAMAAGSFASLYALRQGKRWTGLASLGLFVLLTLLSKSATSLLMIIVAISIEFLVRLHQRGGTYWTLAQIALGVAAVLGVGVVVAPDQFLLLLGKDPTLTGRSELWALVMDNIAQRPVLGWGYAAFWTIDNPVALAISDTVKWAVPQAHNGALEIMINVGMLGLLLFLGLWIAHVRRAFRCYRRGFHSLATICLMVDAGLIVLGVSETVMMEPFQITTSLFFITGVMAARALREAQ